MKLFNVKILILICVVIVGVSGCDGGSKIENPDAYPVPDIRPVVQVNPNLVPVRRIFGGEEVPGPNGFCRLSEEGTSLLVSVKNIGNGTAVDSTTKVTFFGGENLTLPTLQIAGGQTSQVMNFPIPVGCFSSDCSFKIEVDFENTVPEGGVAGGEQNNTENGVCIG